MIIVFRLAPAQRMAAANQLKQQLSIVEDKRARKCPHQQNTGSTLVQILYPGLYTWGDACKDWGLLKTAWNSKVT